MLALTYSSKTNITLDSSFPAVYYSDLKIDGVAAGLQYKLSDAVTALADELVIYQDALGDTRFYFARGSPTNFTGFLDENTVLETTCTAYTIANGVVTDTSSKYIPGCVPETYFNAIQSGNYTLTQR